jgi:putative membrane protein
MKSQRHFAAAGLSVLALALASCSIQRPAPRPAPVVGPTPVPPPPAAVSPAAFVATAASIDLFVVRACELALTRSTDARTRSLAGELREGHRGLAAQLSWAGRRLDALPAARLLPQDAEKLAWLDAQASFDPAFLRQMKLAHRRSLALHAAFAARGQSPTLRPVAANGAAVERAHIALLERP